VDPSTSPSLTVRVPLPDPVISVLTQSTDFANFFASNQIVKDLRHPARQSKMNARKMPGLERRFQAQATANSTAHARKIRWELVSGRIWKNCQTSCLF
jgi:hypothetical protein